MPHYRFPNKDRSLVLCDDRVIAWDARTNAPSAQQIKQTRGVGNEKPQAIDEVTLWKAAGSPAPEAYAEAEDLPVPRWPPMALPEPRPAVRQRTESK